MRVTVVGLGYVGLVTAAGLAEAGHEVVGLEADPARISALGAGRMPFHEPGLGQLVERHVASGQFLITDAPDKASLGAQAVVVAVGTHDGNDGWQTATMRAALGQILPHIPDDGVLVIRSTVPVDFVRELPELVRSLRVRHGRGPIPILTNPEFTREGTAVADFLAPSRVVIGIVDDPSGRGERVVRRLYAGIPAPILVMTAADAALAKIGSNLFLATKISFANELALLCETHGASVEQVVSAIGLDPRIGSAFLRPGVGFGGSCLPHQVTSVVREAEAVGLGLPLLEAVDTVNDRQRVLFVDRIEERLDGLDGARVALLGLSFKPGTDDVRAAPALEIARLLIERGAEVVGYDPMERARQQAVEAVPGLRTVDDAYRAVTDADAIGLVTEWPEFGDLDWSRVATLVRRAVVVDGRNALQPEVLAAEGFHYTGFGRLAVERSLATIVEPRPAAAGPLDGHAVTGAPAPA